MKRTSWMQDLVLLKDVLLLCFFLLWALPKRPFKEEFSFFGRLLINKSKNSSCRCFFLWGHFLNPLALARLSPRHPVPPSEKLPQKKPSRRGKHGKTNSNNNNNKKENKNTLESRGLEGAKFFAVWLKTPWR